MSARLLPALLLAGAAALGSPNATGATRYVFATFLGDAAEKEKLSVYTSSDGLNFKLLSSTGYAGPTGVLRDPTIMRHRDGKYYIAYTVQSWTTSSTSFGIASSTDLSTWTFVASVPAGVQDAHDTWAPEWFKDTDGIHLIVNIDTLGNDSDFRSYDFKAKDDTLKTWNEPVAMGIGPNNIDTFVVKQGATYHAFSKNETTKYIEHATASALTGPWTWVGKNDWAGWGSGKEGISLFQLDNGDFRMFLDCYGGCGFLYATSSDLTSWSKTSTVPGGLSGVVRHGTVLREETVVVGAGGSGGQSAGGSGGVQAGADAGGIAGRVNGGASSAGGDGARSGGNTGGADTGRGGATSSGGTTSTGAVTATDGGIAGTNGTGGLGGSQNGPGGALSRGGAGEGAAPESRDGCGCAVPVSRTKSGWLVALLLGAAAMRRRSRRSSRAEHAQTAADDSFRRAPRASVRAGFLGRN
jgi:MYXO-CTERM domain-containing protein